jgi:hypothetical protein
MQKFAYELQVALALGKNGEESYGPRGEAKADLRLKDSLNALCLQFSTLKELLETNAKEYAILRAFPFHLYKRTDENTPGILLNEIQKVWIYFSMSCEIWRKTWCIFWRESEGPFNYVDKTLTSHFLGTKMYALLCVDGLSCTLHALQILPLIDRVQRQLAVHSLDVSSDSINILKRMLRIGVYAYLQKSLPIAVSEDVQETSRIRSWGRFIFQEIRIAKGKVRHTRLKLPCTSN